jgi:hypothetical protein
MCFAWFERRGSGEENSQALNYTFMEAANDDASEPF